MHSTKPSSRPQGFSVGDFSNDSRLDLVVANNGNQNVGIFFGKGNETFFDQTVYTSSKSFLPVSIATNDFNEDKMSDAAAVDNGNHVVHLLLSL